MKKTKVLYWVFTLLFAFVMFGSAIPDVFSQPVAVKGMHEDLGYPLYLLPFVGIAKWLGVLAILVPGFQRIKEWAYAGLFIDLVGATYSILAVGTSPAQSSFMLLPLSLGALSYFYYHKQLQGSVDFQVAPR